MRRKFYTKKDYQFMPSVGAKQATGVYSEPTYRVRVPEQLRLEPWDYDFELPNLHGIQLDYVQPPGGNHDENDEMDAAGSSKRLTLWRLRVAVSVDDVMRPT